MSVNFIFHKDKLYLIAPLEGNWNLIAKKDISKRRICFEIDTANFYGRFLEFTYPKDYWRNGRIEPVFSRAFVNNNFVYSFFGDHHIYVTSDHVNIKRYLAQSTYFTEFVYPPKNPSMDEYLTYFSETPAYINLLHDRYRDVYYRFTSLGTHVKEGENLQKIAGNPPNVSIIILDSNFNKIGETVFNGSAEYVFKNSFILEDGLYISSGHPDNKKYDENTLTFTQFQLLDYEKDSLPAI